MAGNRQVRLKILVHGINDDKTEKKLMNAEREKSIRWREKVQNKAADWKSRSWGGGKQRTIIKRESTFTAGTKPSKP